MFSEFFSENRAIYEIMWKNVIEFDRPQMTITYGSCFFHAGYLRLQCNTYCLSTATTVIRSCLICTFMHTLPAMFTFGMCWNVTSVVRVFVLTLIETWKKSFRMKHLKFHNLKFEVQRTMFLLGLRLVCELRKILSAPYLTHCGRVTQICVFNTVKLGTSASSP